MREIAEKMFDDETFIESVPLPNDPIEIPLTDEEIERRKERLLEYQYLKVDFEHWVLELERLENSKIKLTSILTGMPSSNVHKRPDDEWDDILDYMDEIHEYLSQKAHERLEELEAFERAVDKLPARERTILNARYIVGLEFHEIEKKFPISERTMYNAHRRGLELLDMTELNEIFSL